MRNLSVSEKPASSGFGRIAQEATLLLGLAGIACVFAALLSHSPLDQAWSTSGAARLIGDSPSAALAWHNWLQKPGAWLADTAYFLLGFSVWWCVVIVIRQWLLVLSRRYGFLPESRRLQETASLQRFNFQRIFFWLALCVLLLASAGLEWTRLYRFEGQLPGPAGGMVGAVMGKAAQQWLGFTGSALLFIALATIALPWVLGFSWSRLAMRIGSAVESLVQARRETREKALDQALGRQALEDRSLEDRSIENRPLQEPSPANEEASPHSLKINRPQITPLPAPLTGDMPAPGLISAVPHGKAPTAVSEKWPAPVKLPLKPPLTPPLSAPLALALLDQPGPQHESVGSDTLEMTSRLIEKKLRDFGVEVRVLAATPGPVITRFELEPAQGVKGAQVAGLARDLARALSLASIRVIETVPGKSCMAMELPNARRQSIRLCEVLNSAVFTNAASPVTLGLGLDIAGHPVVADLAKMPHCLVAGTTGSGKSVGINSMILSLLYKATPEQVRLLLIDPKMLEMSVYEGIPHLLCPVVTDMRKAANGLAWCVLEMERRYQLLSQAGVRNLAGYNSQVAQKILEAQEGSVAGSSSSSAKQPLALPYIVVVIDELADLMMVGGKKIEELIARLAQKARAAGIHLVLATQRPSVDVITGLIKANIPTRLSFQVASKIDSRTILDEMGAETLLGMGDLLYRPAGSGAAVRLHGAFVSDDEVHRVVDFLKKQLGSTDNSHYVEGVLDGPKTDATINTESTADPAADKDPLQDEALAVVIKNRKASISLVQRHLRIGYNRAARLLEHMETNGQVGALQPNGQREILLPPSVTQSSDS